MKTHFCTQCNKYCLAVEGEKSDCCNAPTMHISELRSTLPSITKRKERPNPAR